MNNNSEDETNTDEQSEARVGRILRKTQREVGARDILTFTFGKAWSVLLILGATFVVVADQIARNGESKTSATDSENDPPAS